MNNRFLYPQRQRIRLDVKGGITGNESRLNRTDLKAHQHERQRCGLRTIKRALKGQAIKHVEVSCVLIKPPPYTIGAEAICGREICGGPSLDTKLLWKYRPSSFVRTKLNLLHKVGQQQELLIEIYRDTRFIFI